MKPETVKVEAPKIEMDRPTTILTCTMLKEPVGDGSHALKILVDINTSTDDPGIWGIVLHSVLQHTIESYVSTGNDRTDVENRIMSNFVGSLDSGDFFRENIPTA